jgi:hypothetical protein
MIRIRGEEAYFLFCIWTNHFCRFYISTISVHFDRSNLISVIFFLLFMHCHYIDITWSSLWREIKKLYSLSKPYYVFII